MIECPNCGSRNTAEFRFGGEVVAYPEHGIETCYENVERVWMRENVRGRQIERWFHLAGCRRWVTLERDTLSNSLAVAMRANTDPLGDEVTK
jgi:heterotetrameric sarcosine oxidase delta subunit